ncbi:MAG: LysM peptidoglycan-binding domain-containing protein [Pseudomonadales bacterium]
MRATFKRHRLAARLPALLATLLLASCQVLAPSPTLPATDAAETIAVLIEPVAVPRIARRALPEAPPAPDLWADIRATFVLDHALEQSRVQQELRWLKRHPSYLPRLKERLQRYLPHIHAEIHERGLPGELALLPIVESALDPYAFSHGGAAGLWQFIPATAKRFGLPRNWWMDGRRDPVLATDAALDYLEHLHGRLDDWYLAVAGYNAGEGNVRRALRKSKDGDRTFWVLDLPRETSAYVPRLLALAAVVAEPEAHGLELPELLPEPAFFTIETHGQFDLARAASALQMPVEALYEWNPALNQWATPPEGPHRLHVPIGLAENAQDRISRVPENQRVQWLRIEVARGDTLSQIARRHSTDVATLRRVNQLNGSTIRAGQALFIPRSSEALSAYPVAARTPAGDYQVKPGDSLWSIARAHQVDLSRLIRVNQIGPKEVLKVGQRLNIPGTSGTTQASAPGSSRDIIRKVRYGVRRGDSLAKIANRFNVGVNDLAQWNRLDTRNYLQPGQKLLIYVNVAAAE